MPATWSSGSLIRLPSRQAIVPNLVEPSELAPAVALFNTTRSIGAIIGPTLGGYLIATGMEREMYYLILGLPCIAGAIFGVLAAKRIASMR